MPKPVEKKPNNIMLDLKNFSTRSKLDKNFLDEL